MFLFLLLEARSGGEFQCYPGKTRGDFRRGHLDFTPRRIVNDDVRTVARCALEYHEMIQVPVQDAGGLQFAQIFQFQSQRAGGKVEGGGDIDETFERGPLETDGEALTQAEQIGAIAVIADDHGQAGQAAFGGFALHDQRNLSAEAEMQRREMGRQGSSRDFAFQAVERFQHPFDEAAGVLEHIGFQGHAGGQRLRFAVRGGGLGGESYLNPV